MYPEIYPELIKLHKKQRNCVANLSRKVKAEYFQKHKRPSIK